MKSLEVRDLCYTKLYSLRMLRITGSDILWTPNFHLLPYLEMLDLSSSKRLVEVHESLGNHKRIKSIKLEHCSNLKEFPRIGDMDSLEELILSGTCLRSFPEITGNVNRLLKLDLEDTEIRTLPQSIERATSLETISLRGCKHLRSLDPPLSSSLCIHSSKDLIISQRGGKFSAPQIYLSVVESLEELPETLLSRVVFLHIQGHKSTLLARWIYSNLVGLLHKYQHLCKLQLHGEHRSALSDYFPPTFSDVDSMSNMLRKRDNYFEVEVHVPGGQIPCGFQYRICGSSVNVFIKSIDKLKGVCICGLDAKLTDKYVLSASRSSASFGDCDCDNKMDSNIVVMYIPIDDIIKGDRSDWDGEKECTLFELKSNLHLIPESRRADPIWGLSLVYKEGEGEVDPPIIMTANDRLDSDEHCTMKVMIAESIAIQQPLLEQQLIGVKDEDGSMVYRARLGVAESFRDNQDDLDYQVNNESNYDDKELQQPIDASTAGMNEENVPSEKEMEETVPDEEGMAMSKPNYPTLPGVEYEDGSMVYGGPGIKGIQQSLLGQQLNHVEDEDETIPKLEVTPEFTNVQFWELQKFCSLFTSSYEFDKDTMVQMWVAEGLFEPETIALMEIMADDVFDYLVQEKVIQSIRYEGFIYKMYDTHKIQDLISARSAANDKFVVKEPGGTSKVSESAPVNESELSKLSVLTETLFLISAYFNPLPFDRLCRFKNLCTLILVCEKGYSVKHVPREVFLVLKNLRLLDMHGSGISELPSSIGNLKCLRYLDMSETPIVSLPETVDCLSELQTLKLRNCLGISRLPKDMNKLTNLRHLDLDIIGRLNLMPIGIGCLSKLQTLSAFLIDKAEGYRIGELKALNNLKGSLCLKRLDNISSPDEATEANLIGKKYLSKLELQWEIYPIGRSEIQEKILDRLQPNSNLKELDILYYSGSTFPNWLGDPLCVNIVTLDLFKCENAQHLPSLGGLLSLRSLSLTEMNSVKNINHLFRSTKESRVIHAFPRLEKLTIDIMLNLERWIDIEKGDFPCLVHFSVKCCPKLSELPFLSYVNTLKYLNISECEALQALPRDRLSASLETMIITDCPKLKNRCCSPTGDDWSKIAHVPSIYIDHEPVSHTTKSIPEKTYSL